jgi:hypothetical protein
VYANLFLDDHDRPFGPKFLVRCGIPRA